MGFHTIHAGKGIYNRMLSFAVLAVFLSGLISPANTVHAAPPQRDAYIIVFKDAVEPKAAVPEVAKAYGLQVGFVYSHALKGFSAVVPEGRLQALEHDPRVAYVVEDMLRSADGQLTPTGIQRIFAATNPRIGINGVDDYRVNVDVAVLDTGVDFQHPDLNIAGGVNCTAGSPVACVPGGDDDNLHGTHVAGIIGALDNDIGVVGVAPGARIWSVKVLDSTAYGYSSWIIAGIDWVAANSATIEVANMSLSGKGFNQAEHDAIQGAVNRGVAFAVAAGNNDDNASYYSPGAFNNVLAVSALADFDGVPGNITYSTCSSDLDDSIWELSNYGTAVDIAAPGVCITSTLPIEQGGYGSLSGTSMASPHVAGALALLASARNPNNATDVQAMYTQVINAGNFNYIDDSGDLTKEPLLDVSNTTIFNPVMIAGPGGNPPSTPTNLAAQAISSSQVSLTWSDADATEAGFRIERCTGAGCNSFAEIAAVGDNVTSFSDSNLQASTSYTYRIRAWNASGDSEYSNQASAVTQAISLVPGAPTNLIASVVSKTQINLFWKDNAANETGFKIERCKGAGCSNFALLATVGANITSYSDTKLIANTSYSYRVYAYNASGRSSNSNIATAITLKK